MRGGIFTVNKNESNKNDRKTDPQILKEIHDLPKRYFELMNSGSKLAKEGKFKDAAKEFVTARQEIGLIIRQLLEMQKDSTAQMWQFFGILWTFKLIKSVFYWLLAKSETAESPEEQKEYLMAAVGAQQLGADLIPAFETLHKSFKGVDLELLPMLGEALRNFEYRQRVLEKALKKQDIDFRI